jgi:hypothetical protein
LHFAHLKNQHDVNDAKVCHQLEWQPGPFWMPRQLTMVTGILRKQLPRWPCVNRVPQRVLSSQEQFFQVALLCHTLETVMGMLGQVFRCSEGIFPVVWMLSTWFYFNGSNLCRTHAFLSPNTHFSFLGKLWMFQTLLLCLLFQILTTNLANSRQK